MKSGDTSALEAALGHRFKRRELLEQALTHSSHAHEAELRPGQQQTADNEQLEFLGDAVLGFVTSQELFQRFPPFHEGHLSKLRAHLVSAGHLVEVANRLQLGKYLRLGRGEERSGGRAKAALLVNTLEAVLAALFLDAGLEPTRRFVLDIIVTPELERLQPEAGMGFPISDHKSALQELLQAQGRPQPRYVTVQELGPDHKKTFTVEVRIQSPASGRDAVFRGEGATKKSAEQTAARLALEDLSRSMSAERL
ncbi:MAG: ribonuclease III [Acidobacteria bacterium]|nr:ribonuclease III [Acidobacteriota bacterium]